MTKLLIIKKKNQARRKIKRKGETIGGDTVGGTVGGTGGVVFSPVVTILVMGDDDFGGATICMPWDNIAYPRQVTDPYLMIEIS